MFIFLIKWYISYYGMPFFVLGNKFCTRDYFVWDIGHPRDLLDSVSKCDITFLIILLSVSLGFEHKTNLL